jgi:hypothetical protein
MIRRTVYRITLKKDVARNAACAEQATGRTVQRRTACMSADLSGALQAAARPVVASGRVGFRTAGLTDVVK